MNNSVFTAEGRQAGVRKDCVVKEKVMSVRQSANLTMYHRLKVFHAVVPLVLLCVNKCLTVTPSNFPLAVCASLSLVSSSSQSVIN